MLNGNRVGRSGAVFFIMGSLAALVGTEQLRSEVKTVLDLSEAPKPTETRIWSPLFQASWDKLNKVHGGRPERIVPANALIDLLDKFQWSEESVMPNGDYAIFAGPATEEFARETAKEVKAKFGWTMQPHERPEVAGGQSVYGILVRNLEFQRNFFRSKKKPLEFQNSKGKKSKVSFFGTVGQFSDRYGKSVSVLSYDHEKGDFALQISTKREGDSLIVYRPAKSMSFEKGIEEVLAMRATPLAGKYGSVNDGQLHKDDTVKIPYLSLQTRADLAPLLKGKREYPGGGGIWEIEAAYQITEFELFEKGARVRVETGVDDGPFGDPSPPVRRVRYVRRNFLCDRPFFVFAWRTEAKLPYFAAWIDGEDALTKFP